MPPAPYGYDPHRPGRVVVVRGGCGNRRQRNTATMAPNPAKIACFKTTCCAPPCGLFPPNLLQARHTSSRRPARGTPGRLACDVQAAVRRPPRSKPARIARQQLLWRDAHPGYQDEMRPSQRSVWSSRPRTAINAEALRRRRTSLPPRCDPCMAEAEPRPVTASSPTIVITTVKNSAGRSPVGARDLDEFRVDRAHPTPGWC